VDSWLEHVSWCDCQSFCWPDRCRKHTLLETIGGHEIAGPVRRNLQAVSVDDLVLKIQLSNMDGHADALTAADKRRA
jgi:hypothetical protein